MSTSCRVSSAGADTWSAPSVVGAFAVAVTSITAKRPRGIFDARSSGSSSGPLGGCAAMGPEHVLAQSA
jgi:hypothetical protein